MPGLDHPTLQLHQFALQAEQFAEVAASLFFFAAVADVIGKQGVEVVVVLEQLQFQFFVAVIEQFAVDALHQVVIA
ncbi:hypothetical protein D3C86_1317100 [compost metagenome]